MTSTSVESTSVTVTPSVSRNQDLRTDRVSNANIVVTLKSFNKYMGMVMEGDDQEQMKNTQAARFRFRNLLPMFASAVKYILVS